MVGSEVDEYTIVFNELERLSKEPDLFVTREEFIEIEEIRILKDIVQEIEMPEMIYYTGT